MTKIEFYRKLSDITEHFSVGNYSETTAKKKIEALNAEAETSKIDVEADVNMLKKIKILVNSQIHEEEDAIGDDDDDYDEDEY